MRQHFDTDFGCRRMTLGASVFQHLVNAWWNIPHIQDAADMVGAEISKQDAISVGIASPTRLRILCLPGSHRQVLPACYANCVRKRRSFS